MSPHPLASSHALVTHASPGAYGIRLLTRKESRSALVPAAFLSSHSRDVDIHKASVRTYRAYLAIQSGPAHQLPPISFAPAQPVSFAGTSFQPSDWLEAWARWDSTWLRALVAPARTDDDSPAAYVVMWDARHLTADFSPDDIHIEDTDACNDRMRRERLLATTALASTQPSDPTVCIICGPPPTSTEPAEPTTVYPRGLPLALHALYDQCSRACGTLVVCSTCRLAVCVPCFVAHFPFDAHCDLIPISRASPCHWQCPRCDAPVPPLGSPLSPPANRA
jgi:hypothetical protein